MLYILSYADYESYEPVILEGPKISNAYNSFQDYCNDLLEEVCIILLNRRKSIRYKSVMGWNDVHEEMICLLTKKGYKTTKLEEASYFGGMIIRKSDSNSKLISKAILDKIIEYNEISSYEDNLNDEQEKEESEGTKHKENNNIDDLNDFP